MKFFTPIGTFEIKCGVPQDNCKKGKCCNGLNMCSEVDEDDIDIDLRSGKFSASVSTTFKVTCDESCSLSQDCNCEVPVGTASSGLWIVSGSALQVPLVEDIPPESITIEPDKKGEIEALAVKFEPGIPKFSKAVINVS